VLTALLEAGADANVPLNTHVQHGADPDIPSRWPAIGTRQSAGVAAGAGQLKLSDVALEQYEKLVDPSQ
jgi:hypothetical protein